LLHGTEIDVDAKTRNQSKTIKEITKAPVEATTSTKGKRKADAMKQNKVKVNIY
jgi:hypothetical protein